MSTLERSTTIAAPVTELAAWHGRAAAFRRLIPPWERADSSVLPTASQPLGEGDLVPLARRLTATVQGHIPGESVSLLQQQGPYGTFTDRLRFVAQQPVEGGKAQSQLIERIEASLAQLGKGRHRRRIERWLAYRHELARRDVERHHAYAPSEPLSLAVTGATGFLGTPLVAMLEAQGHKVRRITRRPRRESDIGWDVTQGTLQADQLEGLDAVIHLAGEPIAQRWTPAAKERILRSRVDSTTLLARTLAELERKPNALLSVSGASYYGDTGGNPVDESAPAGEDFLAKVCLAWETAAQPAADAGIRVVHPRLGAVLGYGGGALAKLIPPIRFGVGGPLGSGQQIMPWIALDDALGAMLFLLHTDAAQGPVNLVAPQASRNREIVRTLGRMLRRPTWLPAPAFAIKLAFGEMGRATVLANQLVRPARLEALGYTFATPHLEAALAFELGLAAPTA